MEDERSRGFWKRFWASLPIGLAFLAVWIWRHPEIFDFEAPQLAEIELGQPIELPEPGPAPVDPELGSEPMPHAEASADAVSLTVGETIAHRLPYVRADLLGNDLYLYLSEAPMSCDSFVPDTGARAKIVVPAGPGASFFGGHDIGVEIELAVPERGESNWFPPSYTTLHLEPFELREGARVQGQIEVRATLATGPSLAVEDWRVGGEFETGLCPLIGEPEALPSELPDAPVHGEVAGIELRTRTALAMYTAGSEVQPERPELDYLYFFNQASVTCEQARNADWALAHNTFWIEKMGGSSGDQRFWGTTQPASSGLFTTDSDGLWFRGRRRAWVVFDRVELRPGGLVSGRVYARNDDNPLEGSEGSFAGRFEARTCAWTD